MASWGNPPPKWNNESMDPMNLNGGCFSTGMLIRDVLEASFLLVKLQFWRVEYKIGEAISSPHISSIFWESFTEQSQYLEGFISDFRKFFLVSLKCSFFFHSCSQLHQFLSPKIPKADRSPGFPATEGIGIGPGWGTGRATCADGRFFGGKGNVYVGIAWLSKNCIWFSSLQKYYPLVN